MEIVKPNWCPNIDCIYIRCHKNSMCIGKLPNPEFHEPEGFNTNRFCLKDEKKIFLRVEINSIDAREMIGLLILVKDLEILENNKYEKTDRVSGSEIL